MKLVFFFSLFAVVVAHKFRYFTTDNDHLHVASIMKDPLKVKFYMDCFVGRRICDPFCYSYKKNMPEAIHTGCLRCTDGQKHMWNIFLHCLKRDYPNEYLAFQRKYDPTNQYLDDFMKSVQGY